MSQEITCSKKSKEFCSPQIEGVFTNDESGSSTLLAIKIDGRKICPEEMDQETLEIFVNALGVVSGGLDPTAAIEFIVKTASSLAGGYNQATFDRAITLLQEMKPQDPVEARLLAQHFILHEQGMKYLDRCVSAEMLCHSQHYGKYSMKMLKLSQESIQALTKYRSKGTQQINIVHMQDNAKAVMMGVDMSKNRS